MFQDTAIQSMLLKQTGSTGTITPMAGDASSRKYYRARIPGGTCIVCRDNGFLKSKGHDYPFCAVHRVLSAAGIPVPGVFAAEQEQGLFLIQDLGDDLVQAIYPSLTRDQVLSLYRRIIDIMIRIQSVNGTGAHFSLCFNEAKLMYEFVYFIVHAMICHFNARITDKDLRKLKNQFLIIAGTLDKPGHFVLNHRDFHSRNILLHEGEPWVIDFQDARMGMPHYDLVSLLCDSYVVLKARVRNELIQYYYDTATDAGVLKMGRDEFDYYFDLMAFQRNIKAVGTFGYQCACLGNREYEKYIMQTMEYIRDYAKRRMCVAEAVKIITRYIDLEGPPAQG